MRSTLLLYTATILSSRGLVFFQSKLSYFYHYNLKHTRPTLLLLHNKKHIFPKCLFTYHLPHYLRDITQVWRFSSYDNKLFSLFLHITLPCFTPILFGLAVYWAPINETSKSKWKHYSFFWCNRSWPIGYYFEMETVWHPALNWTTEMPFEQSAQGQCYYFFSW